LFGEAQPTFDNFYKKLQMIALFIMVEMLLLISSKSSVSNGLDLRFAVNFAKAIE
jgi:hypothetical protein